MASLFLWKKESYIIYNLFNNYKPQLCILDRIRCTCIVRICSSQSWKGDEKDRKRERECVVHRSGSLFLWLWCMQEEDGEKNLLIKRRKKKTICKESVCSVVGENKLWSLLLMFITPRILHLGFSQIAKK